MALARDHSTLPKAAPQVEGEPPDREPRFAPLLVQRWMDEHEAAGEKPTANGTRLRFSQAGGCARNLGMAAAGIPVSDPMDPAGVWVTHIGSWLHEQLQAALAAQYPGVDIETKLGFDDLDCSGHLDSGITLGAKIKGEEHRIACEWKFVGGYSYKKKVGCPPAGTIPEGPDYSHKWQGALEAVAWGADELVIGYSSLEAISKPAIERLVKKRGDGWGAGEFDRFIAEWSYPREVFEPWAEAERKRMGRILEVVDEGSLPPTAIPDPEIPRGALVTDPGNGRWELWSAHREDDDRRQLIDTGSTWRCNGYCPRQTICAAINNPGRVSLDEARAVAERVIGGSDGP